MARFESWFRGTDQQGLGGARLRLFHWLCASEIPAACDLRRCGWELARGPLTSPALRLAHRAALAASEWNALIAQAGGDRPGGVMLLGIGNSCERARLFQLGFGDVLDDGASIAELEARAERLAAQAETLPALRQLGALTLDLLARDGFVDGRRVGLHPREFALVWRLADHPGRPVAKAGLLTDVWRLGHVPDTNSLAVHVSRLRAKLAAAGLHDAVLTLPGGGYALALPSKAAPPAIPMLTNDSPLADHTRTGKRGASAEDSLHELRVPRE